MRPELARLRKVSVSQGIMLETVSERLSQRGGPHFGSPDKHPAVRLATLEAAGRARVPFTTGILIGIGETRAERIEALLAIRDAPRAAWPHPGSDHPELPRQARHAHGRRAGAHARGSCLDHRRCPSRPGPGHEHPGAAQPAAGRACGAAARRHQRLGWRVAGHAGPRQPGGALAASGRPAARDGGGRPDAGRAAGDLSGVCASGLDTPTRRATIT